jgi:hypothetical protein
MCQIGESGFMMLSYINISAAHHSDRKLVRNGERMLGLFIYKI